MYLTISLESQLRLKWSPSETLSAFDLPSTVRGSGRVFTVVGCDDEAYRAWSEWATSRGRRLVRFVAKTDLSTVVQAWAAAAIAGKDVVDLIATFIAARTGEPVSSTKYRLKHERSVGMSNPLDVLPPSDAFLHIACEHLLEATLARRDLLVALVAAAQSYGGNVALIPRAVGELLGWERTPAIAFVTDTSSLPAAAEIAAQLVDRSPRLSLAICAPDQVWNSYVRDGVENHAKGLLRAGFVRVQDANMRHGAPAPEFRESARALVALAKRRPSDKSADRRARSEAEKLVYRALEANPYTRGHFELNGTLDIVFGTRMLEVDVLGRACAIALEIDGHFHFLDAHAYRRDRQKDLLMQQKGYLVVRILAEDAVEDLENLVSRMVALVLERTHLKKRSWP